jgi:hypothetical protein
VGTEVLKLDPVFNKNHLSYSVTAPATAAAVIIDAAVSHEKAKYSVKVRFSRY